MECREPSTQCSLRGTLIICIECAECSVVAAGLMSCLWICKTSCPATTSRLLHLDSLQRYDRRKFALRFSGCVVGTYRLESGSAHVAILASGALLAGAAGRDVRVVGLLAVGHSGCSGYEGRFV